MNIEDKANESKKRSNIMMGITIDWQFAMQLLPQVLNEANQSSPEFKILCVNLDKFCTNIEKGIKELKSMIPKFSDDTIINHKKK